MKRGFVGWNEAGQATVEALALVPIVMVAAFGLLSVGVWLRDEHLSEEAAASGAAEAISTLQPITRSRAVARGIRLRTVGSIGEARVATSSRSVLGLSADHEATIRWARPEK